MADSIVFVIANKRSYAADTESTLLFTDCTVSIDHKFENEITEHPVDGDSNIADHIVNKNVVISFSGIYSAYNLTQYNGDSVPAENRVAEAYSKLLALRNNKQKFSVVSRYDIYNNCVVKSLSIPIAADGGNSLIFSMEVQQIRVTDKFDTVTLVRTEDISQEYADAAALKLSAGNKQKTRTSSSSSVLQLDLLENGGG